jgi:hypothetical protein
MIPSRKRHALDEMETVDARDVHGKRRVFASAKWPKPLSVSLFEPSPKLRSVFIESLFADRKLSHIALMIISSDWVTITCEQ